MSLKDKIQEDVKEAMKAKDQHRVTTVRGLFSEIRKVEIDTRLDVTDEQVAAIIQKEIKKRRDAISFAEQAGRAELVEQNVKEIELIQKYLGAELSEAELKDVISQAVTGGADNLGKIMGELNKSYKGRFDGKLASELAKAALG